MNNVPDYSVIVTKCQNDEEKEIELQKQRKILSHKVYDHEKWPLFTFQMIESPNSRILMVSLDLMVCDGDSMQILFTEIADTLTCVLFDCPENYFERLGSIKYAVSQTPQVFLDNQITEMGGRLHISWDVVDELFEACIIDEIFLEFVEDIKRISENNKANSTNDFVTKVWGNILTKEIITKSVVPDLLKSIDLKQIKILDYAQELCPPDVKGQVYVSESEIMNDRNKTYYKILEHPLYGRMADTGIIGVLTHDGYMEFVVPNCETSVETPDKKEDTHEEEIEKPIVKEIMKIWKEVFEIEDISIQDDFYTLGGDSIILMRLVDEMCKTLGCDVTVDDILQSENISDLANRV